MIDIVYEICALITIVQRNHFPPRNLFCFIILAWYVWHLFPSSNFPQRPFELSHFKLLVVHTKYVFHNRSGSCHDVTLAFTMTSSNRCKAKIWELESWFMNFLPIIFQLFALNGFDFILWLPIYRAYVENVSRIRRCNNMAFSLHLKPNLQSPFWT